MRIFGTFRDIRDRATAILRRSRSRHGLRAFAAHKGGAVMLLFGLTLIPLIGFVGGAVDYANAYRMRAKLQDALDTAALAAGREVDMGASAGEAKAAADRVLKANLGESAPAYSSQVEIDSSGRAVTASAEMRVNTYLLGVLGQDYFDLHVNSTVKLPNGKVEVALVLDNSGSMQGSKIRDLQDAAKRLTQILFQNAQGADWVKIGVVPFAASVNVGSGYANASWMDTQARSSIHAENLSKKKGQPGFKTRFDLFDDMRTDWAGCVEVRPSPYDVNDASPTSGEGDTYFVPMFAPDEPDASSDGLLGRLFNRYRNSYLNDDQGNCSSSAKYGNDNEQKEAQERICKYRNERPGGAYGPNYFCDSQEIQALTNKQGRVISAIETMRADGNTNIHEGVMWGWRVLSPGEPFTEGRAYGAEDNNKIMIVMTDGQNTHQGNSYVMNKSEYSAYGYARNGRLTSPTNNTGRLEEAMNGKTSQACTNAKANKVIVYTIAVGVHDEDTLNLLSSCATSRSRAFTIEDGDALTAVFEAIAGEINKLRISS